jgi:hypothetical protein
VDHACFSPLAKRLIDSGYELSREGHESCRSRRVIRTQLYKIHDSFEKSTTIQISTANAVTIRFDPSKQPQKTKTGTGQWRHSYGFEQSDIVLPLSGSLCNLLNSTSQLMSGGAELDIICSHDTAALESYASKTALTIDDLELTAFRCQCYYRTP